MTHWMPFPEAPTKN
ncbi:hypothetical protein [Cronobacter sakazakii]